MKATTCWREHIRIEGERDEHEAALDYCRHNGFIITHGLEQMKTTWERKQFPEERFYVEAWRPVLSETERVIMPL